MNIKLPIELDPQRRREHLLAAGCPQNAVDNDGSIAIGDAASWEWVGNRLIHGEAISRWELETLARALLVETTKTRGPLDASNEKRAADKDALYPVIRQMRRDGEKNSVICAELGISSTTIKRAMRSD